MRRKPLVLVLQLLVSICASSQSFSKTHLIDDLEFGVSFALAPDGRIFTTQKGGMLTQSVDSDIRTYDASGNLLAEFYDLTDSTETGGEYGLIGVTLDPDFAQNHFLYAYYTYSTSPGNNGDIRIRVQRFTEVNNIGTQPVVILELDVLDTMPRNHIAGNIHFRPSDSTHIYVTIGDMKTDSLGFPRMLDNPYGKILRISKYPNAPPPADNPFYDDGNPNTGNCDYIWAYGLRNTFDFCFGPNDSLYATENGTNLYDEVNLIIRGGYYGWPECEGNFDKDTTTLPCHASGATPPLVTFAFPLPSLTGIVFYEDTAFSQQQHHLITGDFNHADFTEIILGNAPAYDQLMSATFLLDESSICGIATMQQGPQGCVYVMEIGDTVFGGIYQVCPDANGISEPIATPSFGVVGPNPFHESTTLQYNLNSASQVSLTLYDALGRSFALLVDESQATGTQTFVLDPQKFGLSSGIYICALQTDQFSQSVTIIIE